MSFWDKLLAIDARLDDSSYYELLGVALAAPVDDIGARYYELVRKIHPDRYARERDAGRQRALTRVYARMGEAHRVLCDPKLRAAYDRALAGGRNRLEPEREQEARRAVDRRDPRTVQGRAMLDKARALLAEGNRKAARAQLDLARQIEPDSAAIAAAVAELDAPAQPAPPPPEPAPEPEPAQEFAREHTRHAVRQPVRLRLPSWDRFETFYTQDMSRGGMFLKTPKPMDKGAMLQLTLSLPDGETISLEAVVAHVRAGEGMGIQFLDMDDAKRARVEAMIKAHAAPPQPTTTTLESLVAELARLRTATPRDALGVGPSAGADEVRAAYLVAARRFHVELAGELGDDELLELANEAAACLRRAYDELRGAPEAPREPARGQPPAAEDSNVTFKRAEDTAPAIRKPVPEPPLPKRSLLRDASGPAGAAMELIARGEYRAARASLKRALATTPNDRAVRAAYHLATGYAAKQAGKSELALQHFQRVLVFDRQCAEAIQELRDSFVGPKE